MDSNTLNVNSLNTNPALKMQGDNLGDVSTTPNPANTFIINPQSSTVDIPTKISSETLSYTSPTSTGIEQPISSSNESMNALSGAIMTTPSPIPAQPTERDLAIKDRQTAIDQYLNTETGYGATSLKLQQEQKLPELQQKLDTLNIKDIALQKQLKDFEQNMLNKNQQGLFGGAGQQAITQYQRDISSQRADLAIEKLAVQGDIKGATDMINLKLNTQFEPIKQRLDYIEKTIEIYGNDLSDSQKAQLELEKADLQQQNKEKENFQKILDDAQMNGASIDEIIQAGDLFARGDRAGAVQTIASYAKNSDLTPYQRFTTTQALAKDTQKRTENAREMARQAQLIKSSYERVKAGGDRSLNTQAIITSFNKILDPTSVVRESEYDRTAQGQALVEQLRGKVDNILAGGAGVTEATLKEASDIATSYLKNAQQSINIENERAKEMARAFGLNEDFVGSVGSGETQSQFTPEMEQTLLKKYTPQQVEEYKKARGFSSVGSDTNQASKIASAIKQAESGGNYNAVGDSGTSKGAYQFQPASWSGWSKQYLGISNAPMTKANQDKVAVARIEDLLSQGYNERQIALIWNGGEPVEKKGFNKKLNIAYDSGAYANKVLKILNKG